MRKQKIRRPAPKLEHIEPGMPLAHTLILLTCGSLYLLLLFGGMASC